MSADSSRRRPAIRAPAPGSANGRGRRRSDRGPPHAERHFASISSETAPKPGRSIHKRGNGLRILKLLSAALAGAALVAFMQTAEAANPRIALVIGESAYPDAALPTAA